MMRPHGKRLKLIQMHAWKFYVKLCHVIQVVLEGIGMQYKENQKVNYLSTRWIQLKETTDMGQAWICLTAVQ